jgi:hypothetical protein
VNDEVDVPGGGRTWRLPVGQRVVGIAFQALFPLLAAALISLPPSSSPGLVSWGVVAAMALACVPLARQAWLESVTLTADALVIRNVFTTRRILLTDIAGVTVGRDWLRVTEAGAPAPTGRHVGGLSRVVGAVRTGGAYWTGRRARADVIAETIARAAGLPPPAARKQVLDRGMTRFMLVTGLVCTGLGAFFGPLRAAGVGLPLVLHLFGGALLPIGASMLYPAVSAAIDYRRGRVDRLGTSR